MNHSGAGATGRRLGRYHLAEPLGGGPTGEVFRAKVYGVAGFERQFAIKRFHSELVGEPDRAAQLAQAARLYGALEHPRIARMHEFGVAGGETFTATELVRGVDLAQLVDATFGTGRSLPAGAAVALLSAAARAVGFAHGRGLAHLGLCPTNVLCTAEGDVKVTDFGFLPLRLPARPSADPSLLARLAYLAPEQHRGESGTPATDVFQLGLLAFELLRGEPALVGGGALEIEKRALGGETPPLNVPKALGHVVRRALARSPYERFPDAGAMADALDAAVRATPLPGDRRDLAGLVRGALDQQAQMHELQMSGALRLPVPAPPRPSQQLTAETPVPSTLRAPTPPPTPPATPPATPTPKPAPAPAQSAVPIAVPVPNAPAGPPAITRRPTPLPVKRTPPSMPVARAPAPPPRKTPPPIPVAAAPAEPVPVPVNDPPSGAKTTEMGALPRPPGVKPPASVTGRIPKIPAPVLRGAGAVPRPPDSGPGRSGLGSGRSGSNTGPIAQSGPAGPPSPTAPTGATAPRRPTPLPSLPRAPQTRPRVATPPPVPPAAALDGPAHRADTTVPGTEVGTEVGSEVGTEVGTDVRTNVATEPGTAVKTVTRSAVPVKLTDTQPGTGPTTLPAQRTAAPPPAPEPDDPFSSTQHESDPDIFAGLFDESMGDELLVALPPPRDDRPSTRAPAASAPAPKPAEPAVASSAAADKDDDEGDDDGGGDELPLATQEIEADEPPLLRTLVGHVPITGATNGTRPPTSGATRSSNIIPRKREQSPAPPAGRAASETEPPDPGEVTVPRRTASVRRVLPTAPPDDAFERDTGINQQSEEVSSSILQAAARAADMGLAQPVSTGSVPKPEIGRPVPPGPESVEIEIVRPHLEPELGTIPTPLPGAATLPDMNYPQSPVPYMQGPPPGYHPPHQMQPPRSRRTALKVLLVVVLLGGMAAGGYFGYMALMVDDDDSGQSQTAAAPSKPGPAPVTPAAASADAGAAVEPTPTPTPAAGDAGAAAPPVADSVDLSINSTPPDAKVYLDGAPVGKTPLRLDATEDRHKLALILPGYKLHTAEIDGKGTVQVDLEEVTPSQGPAGIKVKCKEKNRYYVIVDGVDTGQNCPTERIGSVMGEHNVEIYDPVTDSRRAFPINIVQTRLSHRVKVDY